MSVSKRQPYYEHDTRSYMLLSHLARQRYDQAVEQEYLVYKSSEKQSPLRSAFWDWCIRYARPQVVIVTTPKKAVVEMDLISVDRRDQRSQFDNTSKWFRFFAWELKQVVESYMPTYYAKGGFLPGYFTHIRNVPLDKAEPMAKAFLAVYAKHFDKNRLEGIEAK